MNTVELLTAAKKKIETRKTWTKGAYARNCLGVPVSSRSDEAKSWRAFGSLTSCVPGGNSEAYSQAMLFLHLASTKLFDSRPEAVNDTHGYDAVMKMYDKAIEAAIAAGKAMKHA